MITILYTSISGNVRSFLKDFKKFAEEKGDIVSLVEVSEQSKIESFKSPFFCFVPTYLDGGNGIDSGTTEELTEHLREFIEFKTNSDYCLGIVGSGNKNFNAQYCLTGKQYAEEFNVPFLDDFELRGTTTDIERIYSKLKEFNKG